MLRAVFALLAEPTGPVLRNFPEAIDARYEAPASCPLPPRHDPSLPAAVDEAIGLRAAFDRTLARRGVTDVARVCDAESIPSVVAAFVRLAAGAPLSEAGLPGSPSLAAQDLRAYYEEAALSLVDEIPAARQIETWFYQHTAAGAVLHAAVGAMRAAGVDKSEFAYMMPMNQRAAR